MKQKRLYIQIVTSSNQFVGYESFVQYAVFVSNLFTFNLPLVSIKQTQKLLIEFSDTTDTSFIFPKEQGQNIYTIQEKLVFSEFENESPLKKKYTLTESVYRSLLKLYQYLGLNSSDVEGAYKQIMDNNFMLTVQLCGGIKANKNATINACVTADHFLDHTLIQLLFLENNHLIRKIELFKTVPVYFIYTQLINSAKWIDNYVFAISNNSKEFTINGETNGSYKVTYSPKLRRIEDVKNEVGFLTKEILINI